MVLISVIIPAYNAERTIEETIKSVQQQTIQDFELIIINDGSKDQTVKVIESIEDKRIRKFSYDNAGASVSRNRGISHATGEFISFLDADDLWLPDKLELQLAALYSSPEAEIAYSWTSRFVDDQKECLMPDIPVFFEGDVYKHLLLYNFISNGSNPLISRKAVSSVCGFDPACFPCEDWDFYLRLASQYRFVRVSKHQILYRQSSTSASANIDAMKRASFFTIDKAYQLAPAELQHLKNHTLARSKQYFAHLYLQHSTDIIQVKKAGHEIWHAICLNPSILLDDYAQFLMRWFLKRFILMQLSASTRDSLKSKFGHEVSTKLKI